MASYTQTDQSILAAYNAVISFQKEALSLGLSAVTSLDDDLYLGIGGQHLENSLLFDIREKKPSDISIFFMDKIRQIRELRKTRSTQIRNQIAALEEELANLEGRSDD